MQVWKRHKVFNFCNLVILEIQILDPLLSFKQRYMFEASGIQAHFLRITIPFNRSSVYDENVWYLCTGLYMHLV